MRNILSIIGQLTYNHEKEVGEINIPEISYDVVGLDMIEDWILDLRELYDEIHEEVFPDAQDEGE